MKTPKLTEAQREVRDALTRIDTGEGVPRAKAENIERSSLSDAA